MWMPIEEPVVRPGDFALDERRRIGGSVVDARSFSRACRLFPPVFDLLAEW